MPRIEADNADLDKALHRLEKLVVKGGSWLNPDMIIRERDGELSIEMEGSPNVDEKLIVLSRDVLLPVSQLDISSKDRMFSVKPQDAENFTSLRSEIVDIIFDLYNKTNKLKAAEDVDFWLNLAPAPDVLDRVLAARTIREPAFEFVDSAKKGFEGEALEEFVRNRFISSRVLGYGKKGAALDPTDVPADEGAQSGEQEDLGSVIMPFIDFFNHHCAGSRFLSQTLDNLEVRHAKPVEGSNECYAFYGIMDPLDTFMRYGFVDAHSTVVRSVPMQIDIPDIGRIIVNSAMPNKGKKPQLNKKAKDLEEYIPVMRREKDVLTLSHLYIPAMSSPFALKRVLGMCIMTLGGETLSQEKYLELIFGAEAQVLEKNLSFYKDLGGYLANQKVSDKAQGNAVEQAQILVDAVCPILENYKLGPVNK